MSTKRAREAGDIARRQLRGVRRTLAYAAERSPFYRKLFRKHRIDVAKIRTWRDFESLPVTAKDDVRRDNRAFICIPRSQWAELFATSGSTGEPVYFPYSERDLRRLQDQTAGLLRTFAGVTSRDIAQMTRPLGSGMWLAGLCMWLAFRRLGACTLRVGPGGVDEQIRVMTALGSTIYSGAPSFSLKIARALQALDPVPATSIRMLIMGNENLVRDDLGRNDLGRAIEEAWPRAELFADYGNTEFGVMGMECRHHRGYHYPAETLSLEVLDPRTLAPCAAGETGVLTCTSIGVEGTPLVRYVLGDLSFIVGEPCPCGSPYPRFGPASGRTDEQMKLKGGVTLYPAQVHGALLALEGIEDYLIEYFIDGADYQRKLRILVALQEGMGAPSPETIAERTRERLAARLGVRPEVAVAGREEIAERTALPGRRKPCRFFDLTGSEGKP